jgi:hypothetical protein
MAKRIYIILALLSMLYGVSEAQVTPGTVFSKTEDGNGNKIGSTVSGPDRGLNVFCIGGSCTGGGGGGGTSSTFGAAFPATGTAAGFSDGTPNMRPGFAVDADTGAGTQFVQGVNLVFRAAGGPIEAGILANPLRVDPTGTTTQPVSGTVAVSNAFLLDATFTGRFTAATLDADAIANETTTSIHGKCYLYNGATWDRCRGSIASGLLANVSNAFLLDATFTARINTLGQKTMAASTPVVLASDQASIPVSATVTNAFLLDATFTGRFPVAYLDADSIANQTTTAIHGQNYIFNPGSVAWDRMRSPSGDGLSIGGMVSSGNLVFNSATWDRVRNPPGDAQTATGLLASGLSFFNGVSWDRVRGTIAGGVSVGGTKSNNGGVPGANNEGVLPCVSTAAVPVYTEGNQTGCSTDLSGNTRITGAVTVSNIVATKETGPPPILQSNLNPLQYRAAMSTWCRTNLCPPPTGGIR